MGLFCNAQLAYSVAEIGGGSGGGGGCAGDPADDGNWVNYGWTLPGDPVYGFGDPDPNTQDLVGLAAKGNIVMGDYTNPDFQTYVVPRLTPGAQSVTQPYVIDPSDAALGYDDYALDGSGRPRFSGNYDQQDKNIIDGTPGTKLDGTPRKFYESSLPNLEFQQRFAAAQAINPYYMFVEGVLYTNHAIASLGEGGLWCCYMGIEGAVVARDDAMAFQGSFWIDHDIRMLDRSAAALGLPMSIKSPRLLTVEECPATGCAP